jgi:hypothetical protein
MSCTFPCMLSNAVIMGETNSLSVVHVGYDISPLLRVKL